MDKLVLRKERYDRAKIEIQSFVGLGHVWEPFVSAADLYLVSLEQRVKDLETVLNVINTPDTHPGPLEELGHVRGLDMLQWLNSAYTDDNASGRGALKGWRDYDATDTDVLQALSDRGYAIVEPYTAGCHITEKGMEYLKELKHDLRK